MPQIRALGHTPSQDSIRPRTTDPLSCGRDLAIHEPSLVVDRGLESTLGDVLSGHSQTEPFETRFKRHFPHTKFRLYGDRDVSVFRDGVFERLPGLLSLEQADRRIRTIFDPSKGLIELTDALDPKNDLIRLSDLKIQQNLLFDTITLRARYQNNDGDHAGDYSCNYVHEKKGLPNLRYLCGGIKFSIQGYGAGSRVLRQWFQFNFESCHVTAFSFRIGAMGRYAWRYSQIPILEEDQRTYQYELKGFLQSLGLTVPDANIAEVKSPYDISNILILDQPDPRLKKIAEMEFREFDLSEEKLNDIARRPGVVFLMTLRMIELKWDERFKLANPGFQVFGSP